MISEFIEELLTSYIKIKETKLKNRIFKHKDILELIKKLSCKNIFEVDEIGKSEQGREIFALKFGNGKTKIMIWSQMHGNEPTGTAALFDMLNYLTISSTFMKQILESVQLCIIPMLNPDGTEVYTRVNAKNIDLNRDVIDQKAIESKILRKQFDIFKPKFAFNLHDQRSIFNVSKTKNPAVLSFLAPSINQERTITKGRKETMGVIASINESLQPIIPNQIGRYTDEFYPTATGDNFQKMGCNTILIEAGNMMIYKNEKKVQDIEKQQIRMLNYIAIMQGIKFIIENKNNYTKGSERYFKIPNNAKQMMDIIIRNIKIKNEIVDLGIMLNETYCTQTKKIQNNTKIQRVEKLFNYYGYEEYDAKKIL